MSDYIDGNVKNLIIQYGDKSNAVATVTALTEEFEVVFDYAKLLDYHFTLENAVGKQLDILGRIVGINRRTPFAITKRYFGFDDNPNAYPMDDLFDPVVARPFKDLFEFPYTGGDLGDDDFRVFVKAKIYKNYADARAINPNGLAMSNAVDYVFNGKAYLVDNMDMTVDLYIDSIYDDAMVEYIKDLDLLPRPQTIKYNIIRY